MTFPKTLFVFLQMAQKISILSETLRAHIQHEDIHAIFFLNVLALQILFLNKGSICILHQNCIFAFPFAKFIRPVLRNTEGSTPVFFFRPCGPFVVLSSS
jgi:hypothetical protein